MTENIIQNNKSNLTIIADLPNFSMNGSTIPPDILTTDSRPDLVLLDRHNKIITLLELTCSFETNADSANIRKKTKYQALLEDHKSYTL